MTNISDNMASVYKLYNLVLTTDLLEKNSFCMWDIIILTTFDELQKKSFELHLDEIFANKPLFKKMFYVISDPVGQKLGCGGSTLHVLKTLLLDIGDSIYSKKILIIHSGGCSQRLPSYSSQGKIFSPIPIESFQAKSRVSHMIDLKLAMYLPFCKILGPGVFISCADDIETFNLDENLIDADRLKRSDVVALAHPCDLDTAESHGVYVLPKVAVNSKVSTIVCECLEVLQKPSKLTMREKEAIIKNDKSTEEMVYSDSIFWMSERVCRSLLTWYMENTPLSSELDAYAHFLPCFGCYMKVSAKCLEHIHAAVDSTSDIEAEYVRTEKTGEHRYNSADAKMPDGEVGTKNIKPNEDKDDYKSVLFPILKQYNLSILVLNESKFYHLGSMEEYLHHFTAYKDFLLELQLVKNTSNEPSPFIDGNPNHNENCMLIYSYLSSSALIAMNKDSAKCVIEWCHIELNIKILGDTILSNCALRDCGAVKFMQDCIVIPSGYLFHTMPVSYDNRILYVTVAFEINSNMKAVHSSTSTLAFSGVLLADILPILKLNKVDILPKADLFTLFDVKLFQAGDSPAESFWKTYELINKFISWLDGSESCCIVQVDSNPYFSMKDVVGAKDLKTFLADRRNLLELINVTF